MELDETFAPLEPEALRALGVRRDGPGLLRLGLQLTWLVLSGVLLVRAQTPGAIVAAGALNALAQATFFAPLHESSHGTAFATRWLNRITAWISGFVQLSPPAGMRAFHFAHHRHTHDLDSDPELGRTELLAQWPTGLVGLLNATGLPVLLGRTFWLLFSALGLSSPEVWDRVMPFVGQRQRARVTRDARWLVLAHAAFIAVALVGYPPLLRLYVAALAGHAVLSLYLAAEHRGLPREGSVLERTRSFGGNPRRDFFMWNMPLHAEHHAWPGVPFHQLPALHRQVADQLPHAEHSLLQLHLRRGRP